MKQRIDTLDYLRGFALVGIIFANVMPIIMPTSIQVNPFWSNILEYVISGRFFMIFSFLFGIGFYIFMTRAFQRGDRGIILFIRRLVILLMFGLVHQYFQPGEALLPYAVLGFVLIPFYKLKPVINFIAAITLMVTAILLGGGYFMIFPMFLLGLCIGQWHVFEKISAYQRGFRWVQIVSLCLLPVVIYAQYFLTEQTGKIDQAGSIAAPFVSAFFVTSLTLLLRHDVIQRLLAPLKYLGRMALTNYLIQTALILLASALLPLNGDVHQTTFMNIAIVILIVQMVYSTIWFKYFNIGPVEFIWRIATYKRLPDRYKPNTNI